MSNKNANHEWLLTLLNPSPAPLEQPRACFCIGPQNGEPLCPCRMRGVSVRNGRYIEQRDLGPAPERKK